MPRLIDANKLNWDEIENEYGARTEEVVACEVLIENAPTVDAIPVEWLEKKIEKCKSSKDLYPQLFEEIITIVITEWRKENETN